MDNQEQHAGRGGQEYPGQDKPDQFALGEWAPDQQAPGEWHPERQDLDNENAETAVARWQPFMAQLRRASTV